MHTTRFESGLERSYTPWLYQRRKLQSLNVICVVHMILLPLQEAQRVRSVMRQNCRIVLAPVAVPTKVRTSAAAKINRIIALV